MLIDSYSSDVEQSLELHYEKLPMGANIFLLIDGAFVPGVFREIYNHEPIFLFKDFPGFSEKARDVSPFILQYRPNDTAISRLLKRCSGWPMLSAMTTLESAERLAARLSAWCIVEVAGQRLNFRFPDTRRLPAIYEAMTAKQIEEMCGALTEWRYIDRNGTWEKLKHIPASGNYGMSSKAELNDHQFACLVDDSALDELWVQLHYRGVNTFLSPSQRHSVLSIAFEQAKQAGLDESARMRWCRECIAMGSPDIDTIADRFAVWVAQNMRKDNENSPATT